MSSTDLAILTAEAPTDLGILAAEALGKDLAQDCRASLQQGQGGSLERPRSEEGGR